MHVRDARILVDGNQLVGPVTVDVKAQNIGEYRAGTLGFRESDEPCEECGTVSLVHPEKATRETYHHLLDAGLVVTISEGAARAAAHLHDTVEAIGVLVGALIGPSVSATAGST